MPTLCCRWGSANARTVRTMRTVASLPPGGGEEKVLCDGRRLEPCRNCSPVIPFSRSGPDQRFLLQERAEPPTPCSADLEMPVEGVSSDPAARRADLPPGASFAEKNPPPRTHRAHPLLAA